MGITLRLLMEKVIAGETEQMVAVRTPELTLKDESGGVCCQGRRAMCSKLYGAFYYVQALVNSNHEAIVSGSVGLLGFI